jgi:S-DNA-T family DNA segregation ATPase FtsK/SpoIIIE
LVTDEEIERVVNFIKAQAEPVYNEEVLKDPSRSGSVNTEKDDLYDEAVRVVIESNQASVSILQRRMRLGYTRAARMIDMMEEGGIVGPYEGSKPRRLLVDRDEWLKKQVMPDKQAG